MGVPSCSEGLRHASRPRLARPEPSRPAPRAQPRGPHGVAARGESGGGQRDRPPGPSDLGGGGGRGGHGRASTPASLRCWAVIGAGASVSGSTPPPDFGKAITSRIESMPGEQGADPVPAEGDAAVRRGAEAEGVEQEAELLLRLLGRRGPSPRRPAPGCRGGGYGWSRRRSRCRCRRCRRRRPAREPGSVSKVSSDSGLGEVKAWCTAVQAPPPTATSPAATAWLAGSNSGASTTQQKAHGVWCRAARPGGRSRAGWRPSRDWAWDRAPAAKNTQSPGCAPTCAARPARSASDRFLATGPPSSPSSPTST